MPDKEQFIYLKVLGTHTPLQGDDTDKFSLTNATYTIKNISFDSNFGEDPGDIVEAVSKVLGDKNIIAGGGTKKRRKRRKKNKKRKTINRK